MVKARNQDAASAQPWCQLATSLLPMVLAVALLVRMGRISSSIAKTKFLFLCTAVVIFANINTVLLYTIIQRLIAKYTPLIPQYTPCGDNCREYIPESEVHALRTIVVRPSSLLQLMTLLLQMEKVMYSPVIQAS